MKKLLLVSVLFLSVGAFAQQNVVKANPLGLLFGSAEIGYERAISDKNSFEIAVAFSRSDATLNGSETATATGLGAEGKFKFFFSSSKDAPRGWYAAPVASYFSSNAESGDLEGGISVFAGGAIAGYQWIFGGGDSGFALDLNLGAQYASVNFDGDISSVDIDGIIPRLGVAIGYAW